jgi:hypothetical protein
MQDPIMPRRGLFKAALTALGTYELGASPFARAAPAEIKMSNSVAEQKFDFDSKGIPRLSLSGIYSGSLLWVTTSRAGSMAPCCSTTETRASSQVESDCGQRLIRSQRSMTSPFVV